MISVMTCFVNLEGIVMVLNLIANFPDMRYFLQFIIPRDGVALKSYIQYNLLPLVRQQS